MFSRSQFHYCPFTLTRLVVVCALLLVVALAMVNATAANHSPLNADLHRAKMQERLSPKTSTASSWR